MGPETILIDGVIRPIYMAENKWVTDISPENCWLEDDVSSSNGPSSGDIFDHFRGKKPYQKSGAH